MTTAPAQRNTFRLVIIIILLAAIYISGVWARWRIVDRLEEYYGRMLYIRESALYFHFAEQLAETGKSPELDLSAQYPDGFDVSHQHTFAKGRLTALVYRLLFKGHLSFETFARKFDSVLFCLGVIPFFLLMRLLSRNDWISLLGAAIYALAVPVMQRSSGAGFNMETFAIPFFLAHLWLFLEAIRRDKLWITALSGLALAIAVVGWDFFQFYLVMFGVFIFCAVIFFEGFPSLLRHTSIIVIFLIIAGIANPYLRAHSFLASYGMLLLYPLVGAMLFCRKKQRKRLYIVAGVVVSYLILTVFTLLFFDYSKAYSHVSRKFYSKIKHLNVKPVDPNKLSFSERIEWTPPFHSATEKLGDTYPFIQMLRYAVPALVPLVIFAIGFFRRKRDPSEALIFYNLVAFALLYLMFVRLKVIFAVFLVLSIGVGWRYFPGIRLLKSRIFRAAWIALLILLLLFEITHTFPLYSRSRLKNQAEAEQEPEGRLAKYRQQLRRTNLLSFAPEELFRMVALRGLVEAVSEGTPIGSVILADYRVSPTILAYSNRAIIIHPKFEAVEMRERVEEYYKALFAPKEKAMNDFCNKYGADYMVFDDYVWRSTTDSPVWVYSSKYIANATGEKYDPFGFRYMVTDDQSVSYFRTVPDYTVAAYEPAADMVMVRYKLYEVVTEEDREEAGKLVEKASEDMTSGQPVGAVNKLEDAVALFPGLPPSAYTKLGTAYGYVSQTVAQEAAAEFGLFPEGIASFLRKAVTAANMSAKKTENWNKARTFIQQGRE